MDIRGFRFLPETFHLCIWVNKLSLFYREEYDILNRVSSCQNFQKQPSLYIFFPVLTSKYNFWELVMENIVCFCCTKQLDVLSLIIACLVICFSDIDVMSTGLLTALWFWKANLLEVHRRVTCYSMSFKSLFETSHMTFEEA